MRLLDSIAKYVSLTLAVCAASVIALIMFLTAADVIKRYFTGASIPGTAEFSEVFLVAAVYFGLAFAMRVGAHVGVDLVVMKMSGRAAKAIQIVGYSIGIGVLLWMFVETIGTAVHSISVNEFRYGLIRVPVWPAKVAIPIGLAALILECVVAMLRIARPGIAAPSETQAEQASAPQVPGGI